jgi:hypothetical protein
MITFLPPGHTHVEVDQMFSNLVIYILSNLVQYITDLIGVLTKSNPTSETRPTGAFLSTVFNWKGFLAPHSHDLTGLNKPHAFLLQHQPDGTVRIKFKSWYSSTEQWTGDPTLLQQWLNLMNSYPKGIVNIKLISNYF